MPYSTYLWVCLASYLLASLSSAIIVCRLYKLPDPRSSGSKNPGTTNVLRLGGKLPALLTLVGDSLKGFIPVILALTYFESVQLACWVYLFTFLGHVFPVYYGFNGGKGIATAIGGLFALSIWMGLSFLGVWLCVAVIFRYSSLAALCAIALSPLFGFYLLGPFSTMFLLWVAIIAIYRHKANIQRLLNGSESKIILNRP